MISQKPKYVHRKVLIRRTRSPLSQPVTAFFWSSNRTDGGNHRGCAMLLRKRRTKSAARGAARLVDALRRRDVVHLVVQRLRDDLAVGERHGHLLGRLLGPPGERVLGPLRVAAVREVL